MTKSTTPTMTPAAALARPMLDRSQTDRALLRRDERVEFDASRQPLVPSARITTFRDAFEDHDPSQTTRWRP